MLRIHLEAKHSSSNLVRIYYIDLTQDLFKDWILKITYGRIGSSGHTKLYAFKTAEDAVPKIKTILLKRASAPQRSECQYQLIDMYQDLSFPILDVLKIFQKPFPIIQKILIKSEKLTSLPLFDD